MFLARKLFSELQVCCVKVIVHHFECPTHKKLII